MRQVARRLKDGRLEVVDVPEPRPGPGAVAVRVEASVLSSGTERATLDVAKKGLLAKARARPDQARQVLERARSEGVRSTVALVRQRLEELGPLGYSASGVIIEVGELVRGLAPGDRVAIAGAGDANHAELDVVPALLCASVPESVGFEDAAFATLGAIALNGFRRSDAEVGSKVAVIGLGLIGQLAVRLASAAGCRVIATDLDSRLVELAGRGGADALVRAELDADKRWEGTADAVLICAATASNDPVELAGRLTRDRGPVVVVGDVSMELPRSPFYEKELDLRLSRSYGPGRYDVDHELHGVDYPVGYVRWTERRNMAAFLELVADGRIRPTELITHRFPIADAPAAFAALDSDEGSVGVVLNYERSPVGESEPTPSTEASRQVATAWRSGPASPRLGIVGAGAFATATLIPGLIAAGAEPVAVASASGLSAEGARRKFGFDDACSDPNEVVSRADIDLVVVATRHDSHAELAALALEVGKATYVEKPLTLDQAGLAAVREAQARSGAPLFVGFNRRHAPLAKALETLPGPRVMAYRVNAGPLPDGHWANDPRRGGGRLKGEGCHFIDFLCAQAGSDPTTVTASGFGSDPQLPRVAVDNFTIQIVFADGSVGTVGYAADAPRGPGKERFETSASGGGYAEIDDFKRATIWTGGKSRRIGRGRQDKGFQAQFASIVEVVAGRAPPPSVDSVVVSTLATLAAARSLETGLAESVVSSEPLERGAR